MNLDTDDLVTELGRIKSLANIGSTSDADAVQLQDLFFVVLEMVARAEAHVRELKPRPKAKGGAR
jgi:hypothetical protein